MINLLRCFDFARILQLNIVQINQSHITLNQIIDLKEENTLHTVKITPIDHLGASPLVVFKQIQDQPWSILLDSGDDICRSNEDANYSIIASHPIITLQVIHGEIILEEKVPAFNLANIATKNKGVFEVLSEVHTRICQQVEKKNTPLPFLCGWLGSFNYDLNIYTDAINESGSDEYALQDLCLGFYANSLIFDKQKQQFYWCNLGQIQENWLDNFVAKHKYHGGFKLLSEWHANMSREQYLSKLKTIKDYLIAGDCYQVNFAQRFCANYSGSEFAAFTELRESNRAHFSAFFRTQNSAIISVSPERFLAIKEQSVESKPIKGTRPRDTDKQIDAKMANELLSSDKDRAENLMIVDLLRNDLSKHCKPFSVQVPKLFALESYPAVHHMVSTIRGELREEANAFDLLGGAFPGGSITGCPKVRAMQIIDELEPNKRSIYCGSLGYLGINGDMDTNICIRTLLAENGKIYCWAGGGIVYDSNPEEEYQESLDKVAKILPVLRALSE